MKKMIKKLQYTVVLVLKIFLFFGIFSIFFGVFGIKNWQLLVLSRTAGVTMLTFVTVGLGMLAAYGSYDIGKRKSKPIIYSIGLATIITDIVTYIELSIMNTNSANNTKFVLEDLEILMAVAIIQVLFIVVMAYFGNYIYFRMNKPEKSCIIASSQKSLNQVYYGIDKYKLQYDIKYIIDYKDENYKKYINECDTVFLYDVPIAKRKEIVEYCYQKMKNIYFNPEISDIVEMNSRHVLLDDVSLINFNIKELTLEQKIIKRAMDISLSLLMLLISSPIWIISAIAIKINDNGKIFFKQKRATKDGKVFEVYKFRTMKENVVNYSVIADDDRITSIGKILRKTRMDELPQILNILKGDMSLVGPRPEMLENVHNYTKEIPEFEYRLRVKAGLTGYAQIAGKYNTSPRDKLILDLMYIENYTIWKDVKLLLQTLIVFFKSDSTEAFGKKKEPEFASSIKISEEKK